MIKNQQIRIEVEGLSCPFCAYGLEKKLKKIDGIEKLIIDFEEGTVVLTTAKSKDVSNDTLNKAIEDSGFTPKKIVRNFINDIREKK